MATVEDRPRRLSLEQRKELAAKIPWVRTLRHPWPCDGIKWSRVSLKDLYSWGPKRENPPRGIRPEARCKKTARWSYRHLNRVWRKENTSKFCWDHLMAQGLYGSMEDTQRTTRWFERHPEAVEESAK